MRASPICPRVLCFLLALAAAPYAQNAAADAGKVHPGSQLGFEEWGMAEGLPQNSVTAIARTPDGYLWLGTFGGLVRFDGEGFRIFDIGAEPELASNRITALHVDRNGALWIGTQEAGVQRMRHGTFTTYLEGVPRGAINGFAETARGELWCAGQGIGRFRADGFETVFPDPANRADTVHSLVVDDADALWLGTDRGLFRLAGDHFTAIDLPGNAPPPVWEIALDGEGRRWAFTSAGASVLSDEGFRPFSEVDHGLGIVEDVLLRPGGDMWVGGEGGLVVLRPTVGQGDRSAPTAVIERRFANPVVGRGVRALFEDPEGSIWIGTSGTGLRRARPTPFTLLGAREGLALDSPRYLTGDGGEGLWLVPRDGPLLHETGSQFEVPVLPPECTAPDGIEALCAVGSRNLWIATRDGRLVHLEGERTESIPHGFGEVGAVLVDRTGTVWLGLASGLAGYRNGEFEIHRLPHNRRGRPIHQFSEDLDGALWFVTSDVLGCLRQGEVEVLTAADGLPRGDLRGLQRDDRGTLWITSYGGGLCRLRAGELTRLGVEQGLADNSLGGILQDADRRLWVNSNRGVMALRIDELNDVADGKRALVDARTYATGEGTGAYAHRTADGRMWFPTIDGLAVVDPSSTWGNPIPPPVVIESVRSGGEGIAIGERALVPPGEGDLEIHYAGLSFARPGEVRFRYFLEGYDEDWVEAGNRRTAYYTKVPPGQYRFTVLARNEDGVWNETGASIDVELLPHYYQTGWFLALVGITGIAGVFALHRLRLRSVEKHNRELEHEIRERERAEAERRRIEKSLRESTKLEAVGRLAGGIAHDLNNVLTAILGHAELMGMEVEDDGKLTEHVAEIRNCGNRASSLTRDLLAFSRQQIMKPRVLDPNVTLRRLRPMLRQLLPENIELVIFEHPEIHRVRVDASQLEQVIMNLVLNSRDAMPEGGTITVETNNVMLGRDYVQTHPESRLGEHVMIAVTDTGQGIGESVLPHVFEPFFTTKQPHKGTGLGLASVHGIVKQSGGHILVYSEPGAGATFKVYLPAVDAEPEGALPHVAPRGDLAGTETVLVCDDFAAIRHTVRMSLQARGYEVHEAGLPSDALSIAREHPGPIHLLITDVVMPEMNGNALATQFRALHPEASVLFISGYTPNVVVHRGVVDDGLEFLEKPFTPTALLERVRGILDAAEKASGRG